MEELRSFTNMGIIKTSEIFQGNILEKNEQRIEMIKITKDNGDLLVKIEKLFEYINKNDLQGVQYMIENELFYEKVPDYVINKYIIKLNKYCNIEDFREVYKLKAQNGFRRTMDYLVRKKH